jgi:hypothetical protein
LALNQAIDLKDAEPTNSEILESYDFQVLQKKPTEIIPKSVSTTTEAAAGDR